MIHVFADHTDNDKFYDAQRDPDAGQWGGHGQHQVQTGTYSSDPNSEFFKSGSDAIMGGVKGTSGAEQDVARYRAMADAAAGRTAPVSNWSVGNGNAADALSARQGQNDALAMIRQRAYGGGASAATIGMMRGNDQIAGGQLAAMAGARPGQLGMAQQGAAGTATGMYGTNLGQAGAARGQELSGAQNGMFTGYQDMRNGDLAAQRMQDDRSQHMANLILQQRGMNQGNRMAYEGMGFDVEKAQMEANAAAEAAAQAHRTQQGNLDMASRRNQDNTVDAVVGGGASAVSAGAGAYAASDVRVKDDVRRVGFQNLARTR